MKLLILKLINKYYWLFTVISYALIVFFAYGFVKDLYFWRDDFALLYRLQQGGLFDFPYQGWSLIYYPIYLFFKDTAQAYFISSLVVYLLLCVVTCFFVLKLTGDKSLGFLSGLILSSGYIGAEIMFMSSVSMSSIVYLLMTIILLLLHKLYIDRGLVKIFLLNLMIFTVIIILFSQRAHTLFLLLFVFDYFYKKSVIRSLLRILPMGMITIGVYLFYSIQSVEKDNVRLLITYLSNFHINYTLDFLTNISHYLFPEFNIYTSSILGLSILIFIIWFFRLSSVKPKYRKFGILVLSLWIFSYLNYHLSTPLAIHNPSQRYLFFGYPFFSILLGLIIKNIFFIDKRYFLKIMGSLLVILILFSHVQQLSPQKEEILQRALQTKNFFSELKLAIPILTDKSLFYFDLVDDSSTEVEFWDILRVGIYSTEASLASFYNVKIEDIKIVDNYDEYLKEKGHFKNSYHFFYNKEKKLIFTNNLSPLINEQVIDLTAGKLYEKYVNDPNLDKNTNGLYYQTFIASDMRSSNSLNGLVIFPVSSFPSYKNLRININMQMNDLFQKVSKYPYYDNSIENIQDYLLKKIHQRDYIFNLMQYVNDRESFKKLAISSSNNLIDGDYDTKWEADKKTWIKEGKAIFNIKFSLPFWLSQIRWFSYKPRAPTSYEYQIKEFADSEWRTIIKKDNLKSADIVARDVFLPVKAVEFRMIIYKTENDEFPGLSEIELLQTNFEEDSKLVDLIINHPFTEVNNLEEALFLKEQFKNNFAIEVYTLSDKFLSRNEKSKIIIPVKLDNQYHVYKKDLDVGGTKIIGLILKFPNLPLESFIESIILESVD